MRRNGGKVPDRVAWAIDLLAIAPADRILEVGCGPGVAVGLVADQLDGGQITAIDRSGTAIEHTRARNAPHIADGRVHLQQVDLAGFDAAAGPFDKAFAINVNVFWTSDAAAECAVLADALTPTGVLRLIYGGPGDRGRDVAPAVIAALTRNGYRAEATRSPDATMTCITGRR